VLAVNCSYDSTGPPWSPLVLKTPVSGAKHGNGIVEHLRLASDDVLCVGESALYPALERLLLNGWVKDSGANRRALLRRPPAMVLREG
jgi:DNA-binding PadR family transcriptional regulator